MFFHGVLNQRGCFFDGFLKIFLVGGAFEPPVGQFPDPVQGNRKDRAGQHFLRVFEYAFAIGFSGA